MIDWISEIPVEKWHDIIIEKSDDKNKDETFLIQPEYPHERNGYSLIFSKSTSMAEIRVAQLSDTGCDYIQTITVEPYGDSLSLRDASDNNIIAVFSKSVGSYVFDLGEITEEEDPFNCGGHELVTGKEENDRYVFKEFIGVEMCFITDVVILHDGGTKFRKLRPFHPTDILEILVVAFPLLKQVIDDKIVR